MDTSLDKVQSSLLRLKEDQILFKEGQKAEHIYIVAEGLLVGVKEKNKRLIPVLRAQVKSVLGLEALSSKNQTYIYSAIVKEPSEVVPIDIKIVKEFFEKAPDLMDDLLKTLMDKVIHTTELLTEHRIIDDSLYSDVFTDDEEMKFLKLLKE